MRRILAASFACLGLASLGDAKVAAIPLASLERQCPLVVVAKIAKVDLINGVRIATADVESVPRGQVRGKQVRFLAEPTWSCDTSSAKVGELVLLYLRELPKTGWSEGKEGKFKAAFGNGWRGAGPIYQIGHSGRGRVQLQRRPDGLWAQAHASYRSTKAATLWTLNHDVLLPRNLPVEAQKGTLAKGRMPKGWVALRALLPAALPLDRHPAQGRPGSRPEKGR